MADTTFLDWPFFEDKHRELRDAIESWCCINLPADHSDTDAACIKLVNDLGAAGFLKLSAVDPSDPKPLDVRSLCIMRETLARHDGLGDFAFAMQGLGTGAISLFGNSQQQQWLNKTRAGETLSAFALTEPNSGSDVANIELSAIRDGDDYVLNGEKTWISNGGIAGVYVVFARTGEAAGAKGISAFIVPADTPGLTVEERLDVMAPHPLARLGFKQLRIPASNRIGEVGQGFKIAMSVLDVFRCTVGAAALGFARRALEETIARATTRKLGDGVLADMQMVQGHMAEMAIDIDASALLIYRAAWTKDMGAARVSREAAMAKQFATDQAQQIIDKAVQIHGGEGVRSGNTVEKLYREIRALRIYEGASDVQKIIVARQLLSQEERNAGTKRTQGHLHKGQAAAS
ncbi:Acyl-CoA dehydrogenase [Pseudovibrio axinellae]|uniref:Acyl-CoA dehydrogenase n=1 Tax=Pseudovibrio axinellae TaxID=989403 RepID=A0A165XI21_9HYPH|nr:acyl-CoA dehydrogenase family protein [Pseudovibrio axinellae]KZL17719.1 Acyl-CoA dehydrogenase [Pseudovibrio axinellae]SER42370.1 acyl-CoA dehydrogenase [Pseudovibrio axinellae]